MKRNAILFSLILMSFPLVAAAADFGAHIGYYDNDVKKAYIGADLSFPIGPIAIMPNIDYWKEHSEGYWLGGGDIVLRYGDKGMAWWLGAGPTYGYVTGYHEPATVYGEIGGPFGNGKDKAWGWDANGGVTFGNWGGVRPYVTGRYNKVKDLKVGGVAVGIRFGQ